MLFFQRNYNKVVISASFAPSLIGFRLPLIERLLSEGIKVVVIAPEFDQNDRKKLYDIGCDVEEIFLKRNRISIFFDLIYIIRLISLLIKHRPAVIISYTAKPNLYGALVAKLTSTRCITLITGLGINFLHNRKNLTQLIFKYLFKKCMKYSDLIVFQNEDDVKDLKKMNLLTNSSNIGLVNGSGVNTDFFSVRPFPTNLNFLMLSRLLKSKGVIEYIEAAKIIKEKGYEATFTLAGSDDYGPDAVNRKHLIKNYSQYVEILQPVKDVRKLLRYASVYVLPSYREGTPRSVLEAMSMGRPIITTDAPGCRETVIDKHNGLLVEVENVTSLVSALEEYCKKREIIVEMGKKSRELVLERFEINFVTEQYFQHISRVLFKSKHDV